MKTLSLLSGAEILKRTRDLVAAERHTTMELIEHLREVERRMLFLETGHSSLFEFAVKHLGLSEGSAQRRISAMRLIRDIPEAKMKLESGEISLSNAAQVQSVFRLANVSKELFNEKLVGKLNEHTVQHMGQKMGIEEKKDILEKISGMTQKECQSALLELVPQAAPKLMERDRQVSEERFELKLVISKQLHDQIDELKILLSHSLQSSSISELLEYLVKQEIRRQEKKRGMTEKLENGSSGEANKKSIERTPLKKRTIRSTFTAPPVQLEPIHSRKTVPLSVQREMWRRTGGMCQYPNCKSRYRLEFDHIVPYAQGGQNTAENLRLYCRAHNLAHAIESYGIHLVNRYRRA